MMKPEQQRNRPLAFWFVIAVVVATAAGLTYILGPEIMRRVRTEDSSLGNYVTPQTLDQNRIRWQGHELMPWARVDIHEELVTAKRTSLGPADGGGTARLVKVTEVKAGEYGQWTIEYRAGPLGVAVGGSVQFQIPPFWKWGPAQMISPEAPGYTTVTVSRPETTLSVETFGAALGQSLLMMVIQGRPLEEGDTITLTYGAGEAGVRTDRFAEEKEFFYLWVDGDGDGSRRLIDTDLSVAVLPGPATDLVIWLPSTAASGETVPIDLAFLDGRANAAPDFEGVVTLSAPEGLRIPDKVIFEASHVGHRRVEGVAEQPGTYLVEAQVEGVIRNSNVLVVTEEPVRIFWGDLHGHSTFSDGTATAEEYYRYARDFAALDVAALTDHDHFGIRKLDESPQIWNYLQGVAEEFNEPKRFVTLFGYEWTSWLYGHRHVLYFLDRGPLFSSVNEISDTPAKLWALLESRDDALTIAHHTGGGPVATDWSFAPPPRIEPVVEIVSVHGSSESINTSRRVAPAQPGAFVDDALRRGYRLGFVGSGDSHDGHPGLVHRNAASGGIVAILADELTRQGVLEALRRRSVYATNGRRIYLEFALGGTTMGGSYHHEANAPVPSYRLYVASDSPLVSIELMRNGIPTHRIEPDAATDFEYEYLDPDFATDEFIYLRVEQQDGGMAWSSPIWIEDASGKITVDDTE